MNSLQVPSRSARGARVGRSGRLSSAPLRHHNRERFVTVSELTEREFAIEMGRRLRQLRSQVGMTQIELGRRVGVHRNTIRNLEIGQGADSRVLRMKARDSYHCTPRTVHRMVAVTDVDVIEVSTPELDDVVRLEDAYGREGTTKA